VQADTQLSHPMDAGEQLASSIANNFSQAQTGGYHSSALGMRNNQRIGQVNRSVVHRDIKGYYNAPYGKIEVDFAKKDATAAGANASEEGEVRFHPNDSAPESDAIRLVQIVRVIDTTSVSTNAGDPWEYGGAEADRNNVRTTADAAKNIAGGLM